MAGGRRWLGGGRRLMECERAGVGCGERLDGCVRGVAPTEGGTHASGVLAGEDASGVLAG